MLVFNATLPFVSDFFYARRLDDRSSPAEKGSVLIEFCTLNSKESLERKFGEKGIPHFSGQATSGLKLATIKRPLFATFILAWQVGYLGPKRCE